MTLRNWIPQWKWVSHGRKLQPSQAMHSNFQEHSQKLRPLPEMRETEGARMPRKHTTLTFQESRRKSEEHSQKSRWQSAEMGMDHPQNANEYVRKCEIGEHSQNSLNQQWCELSEVVESDFLISPGDDYPNRKVELEDADVF